MAPMEKWMTVQAEEAVEASATIREGANVVATGERKNEATNRADKNE
jgi:hypothetical protein